MRCSGDVVEALVLERLDVAGAVAGHVDQRRATAPVFVAAVDLEEAGQGTGRPRPVEQARALTSALAAAARERELVAGIVEVGEGVSDAARDGRSGD